VYLLTGLAQTVKGRLDRTESVLELEKEGDKKHIFDIMKYVDKEVNGCPYYRLKNKLKMSNTYLAPYIAWLKKNDFLTEIKGKKFLNKKGRKALIELDDYFSSAETSLKFMWETGFTIEGKATVDTKISDATKNAVFSNQVIQQKIIELAACLANLPEGAKLTVEVPPIGSTNILAFLKVSWNFYWKKVTDSTGSMRNFAPLYINLQLTDKKSTEKYLHFWKEHLRLHEQNEIVFQHFSTNESGQRVPSGEEFPLKPLLPIELQSLLPYFIDNKNTKQWIESQLEKDPDWFMPHSVWVALGFKQRRDDLSVDSIEHVSPPIFHRIVSQELPRGYGLFDSVLKYMVQKGEESGIKALCLWIQEADWKETAFYESWKLLRNEYRSKIEDDPKLKKVSEVLDCAFVEYIKAEHAPFVNLEKVFSDYLQQQDTSIIIEGIRKGNYKIQN